jgi:hypothetical protein
MRVAPALVLLAGCWTGPVREPAAPPEPAPAPKPVRAFELELSRGPCFGRCPVFRVHVRGDGRVTWEPERNTAVTGKREHRISAADVAAIERALDAAQFFDRDPFGQLKRGPTCVRTGNTTSCSFTSVTICSDTSHTIIAVRRGGKSHRVDNAHCSDEDAALNELEETILDRTGVRAWIGE